MKCSSVKSSLQINIENNLANEIINWGKANIQGDELDPECGLEDDIHITILYGVLSPITTIRNIFKNEKPIQIVLRDITVFQNEKYDVLKIDVEGDRLHRLHRIADNDMLHMTKHPTFQPHITIAYINKEFTAAVISRIDRSHFNDRSLWINELTLTTRSEKRSIKLFE